MVSETRESLLVLRADAMGNAPRRPGEGELDRMRRWVRQGVAEGAVGLSTGLIYEPGCHATTEELVALARELGGADGGVYATHLRDEAGGLLASLREAIEIGERAEVSIQISHHKAAGRSNRGLVRQSLRLIEEARDRGVDVTADQYPYTAGATSLAAVIANRSFEDPPGGLGRLRASDVVVSSAPGHPEYEGRTLEELRSGWGSSEREAAERLARDAGDGCHVVIFLMDEDDVQTVMAHRTTMIGSDGDPVLGNPHPRLYGCFPRVLGRYVRERSVLDLPTAVHRMTGMPARKFRLGGRGVVREQAHADLVVFDPLRIADRGTYEDPRRFPEGILAVYVNGVAVARDGTPTGARPGRALRREDTARSSGTN